jgi:regulatory protein
MRKSVVEIGPGHVQGRRLVVFDDGSNIEVNHGIIESAGIRVGREIDVDSLVQRIKQDDCAKCYDAGLHFLEFRARSEEELRRHLLIKRKFDAESVERAVEKLKEVRLIDDKSFAESWTKDRLTFKPRSRLMIKRELLLKGVDKETAGAVIEEIDDGESAYQAGLKKARLLKNLEYPDFYRKLAGYLGRRGYSGDVVHGAVKRLWSYISDDLSGK